MKVRCKCKTEFMGLSRALEGKRVKITCTDGKVFEGTVTDYIYPEDSELEGLAAIYIEDCPQLPGREVGFNENEISSIQILDSADRAAEQIAEYDRIQLKDGRTGTVCEVLKPGAEFLVDIDISGPDWETTEISLDEILKKIKTEDENNT